MRLKEEFVESTIEAMVKAQSTSLTAQVGVAEYSYLRAKGIQPKIVFSKSLGFRVRDPGGGNRFSRLAGEASSEHPVENRSI